MAEKDLDLVSKLTPEQLALRKFQMNCVSPDDGKYGNSSQELKNYLTPAAEWQACIKVQRALLATRIEFNQARPESLVEFNEAARKADPVNISLLEEKITKHDQLAVLEELGRFMSPETKALLHPGTTSYDVLDTARSMLFQDTWYQLIRPQVSRAIEKLCEISEKSEDILQVGRTHLQDTSPVTFGLFLSGYASRLADRVKKADVAFLDLRGKISGITGTGAGIEMVVGKGNSIDFEKAVLARLNLKPDYAATQVTPKERLADAGHSLVTLAHVLGDFANDIRILYSSAIQEVASRDNAERLGGSSTDAGKNNPIQYENIAGKTAIVEAGMRVLYQMITTDLQRDLRSSVQARYQPQQMMAEVYEMFARVNNALPQLSVNGDKMQANLQPVRERPTEAMTTILRGEPEWTHSKYGLGHDFVRAMAIQSKTSGVKLLTVSLLDPEFRALYHSLSETKQEILQGKLEFYLGSAKQRAQENRFYARLIARGN